MIYAFEGLRSSEWRWDIGRRSSSKSFGLRPMSCPRHVFYQRVNELLAEAEFASWLEQLCRPHDSQQDRGSIAPGGGFSDADGRLLRGHRLTTRDRVAVFRQFVADEFPGLSATGGDCRAFESDADHVAVSAGD